jgi:hypothetical protein
VLIHASELKAILEDANAKYDALIDRRAATSAKSSAPDHMPI